MRQLALKKKESRLLWRVLVRGLVATDRVRETLSEDDREAYQQLRQKVITAWKAGIVMGGVRPKKEIASIMPNQMLMEAGLPALKKSLKKVNGKTKNHLAVPHRKGKRAA